MNTSKLSFKRLLVIATITLLSTSALLGILFVIIGVDATAWKVCGTVALLGILSLISMSNIFRLEDSHPLVKVFAVIAIAATFLWTLLLIGTIWDVYRTFVCTDTYSSCSRAYSDFMQGLLKVMVTGIIVSISTTIIAGFLRVKNNSIVLATFKYIAIASTVFLAVYFLPAIWMEDGSYINDSWRLVAVVGIIFAFAIVITPIISRIQKNKNKQGDEVRSESKSEAELRKEIEAKVRAEIASEQTQKNEETNTPAK